MREFALGKRVPSWTPAREEEAWIGPSLLHRTGQDRAKPGKIGQSRARRRIDGFFRELGVQTDPLFRSESRLTIRILAKRLSAKTIPFRTSISSAPSWGTPNIT